VLKLAREHGVAGPPGPRPERLYYEIRPKPSLRRRVAKVGAAAAIVAVTVRVLSATVLRPEAP
jgi:hypothetical protein